MTPFKVFEHSLSRKLGVCNCPYCHLDTGDLICNDDGSYYVLCSNCGSITHEHPTAEAAILQWRKGDLIDGRY